MEMVLKQMHDVKFVHHCKCILYVILWYIVITIIAF